MLIRKLPPHIVQNIAAGELVERPASILKELIENSIDAGASQIKIDHQQGGIEMLRVTDNGQGISADEMELVFESHATSKIRDLDDLNRIKTMGFRGEAMSSIASVARVNLRSTHQASDTGCQAEVQFGRWLGKKPVDRREGTEISVHQLFEKLPARRKFLKSELAEARQLSQVFKRYALSYPEIQWSFSEAGDLRYKLAPSSFFERALWFFEAKEAEHFFEAKTEEPIWNFHFIGMKPRYLKPNRQGILIFLNKRPIKDRSVEFAVRRAFDGFAERPQEVMGVLHLQTDPELFDVNVHPAKTEVRFRDSQTLFSGVVRCIRKSLDELHKTEHGDIGSSTFQPQISFHRNDERPSARVEAGAWMPALEPLSSSAASTKQPLSFSSSLTGAKPSEVHPEAHRSAVLPSASFQSSYEYLGSIERTFWLAKKREQLFLFDQHALHERILYEQLCVEVEKTPRLPSQRLLFPLRVDFEGVEDLLEEEELLERLGFEIRKWRDRGVQVLAVPSILKKNQAEALEAIAKCRENAKENFLREILARIACHSAIRAHDEVYPEEAKRILSQFESDDALGHCPHGRPTFIRWDFSQIEKFFHRT
ncbi:MAG: DNA mismatch repair endonuclease MutL [Bdellovibrionota bacterium]